MQHLSVVASTYSLSATQNNTQSKLCLMFKYIPNGKDIYGPMEYSTNGKDIMAPMKCILIVFSLNWKCMVLWKTVFEIGGGHGER